MDYHSNGMKVNHLNAYVNLKFNTTCQDLKAQQSKYNHRKTH
jgi:hypothetical protein